MVKSKTSSVEQKMTERLLRKKISEDQDLSQEINNKIMKDPYLKKKIIDAETKIEKDKTFKSPVQKKHQEEKAGIELLNDPEVVKRLSDKLNKSPLLTQELNKRVKQVKNLVKKRLSPKKITPVMKSQSPESSKSKSSSSKKASLKKNKSKHKSSSSLPKSSSSTPKSSSSTSKSSSSTSKSYSTPKSSSSSSSISMSIIPQESINKLKNLRDEIEPKKVLDKKDVIKVKAVLEDEMGRLKESCMRIQQNIKDNHIPDTQVNYSEKDKKCLIEGSYHVSDLFTFLRIKKMLNQEASRMRNKLFSSMGQGPLSLFTLMNYLRSNNGLSNHLFSNSMFPSSSMSSPLSSSMSSPLMSDSSMSSCSSDCPLKNSIFPVNLNSSPYKIYKMPIGSMNGGSYLGRVNNCPNNGRLVSSTQGVIGCGNQLNQGGQEFIYPRKISACKIGGKKKKSLKKK